MICIYMYFCYFLSKNLLSNFIYSYIYMYDYFNDVCDGCLRVFFYFGGS